jgi:hypothetical protein
MRIKKRLYRWVKMQKLLYFKGRLQKIARDLSPALYQIKLKSKVADKVKKRYRNIIHRKSYKNWLVREI